MEYIVINPGLSGNLEQILHPIVGNVYGSLIIDPFIDILFCPTKRLPVKVRHCPWVTEVISCPFQHTVLLASVFLCHSLHILDW